MSIFAVKIQSSIIVKVASTFVVIVKAYYRAKCMNIIRKVVSIKKWLCKAEKEEVAIVYENR
jgi:hypothetical protein